MENNIWDQFQTITFEQWAKVVEEEVGEKFKELSANPSYVFAPLQSTHICWTNSKFKKIHNISEPTFELLEKSLRNGAQGWILDRFELVLWQEVAEKIPQGFVLCLPEECALELKSSIKKFSHSVLSFFTNDTQTPFYFLESDTWKKQGVSALQALEKCLQIPTTTACVIGFYALNDFYQNVCFCKVIRILSTKLIQAYGRTGFQCYWLASANCDSYNIENKTIKTSIANISSGIGGAELLLASAFGTKQSSDLNLHLSQMILNIMESECHLNQLTDPTAGSYFFQTIIKEQMQEIWQEFIQ